MKDSKECETQTEETSHMVEEMLVKVKHLEERLATVQQNLVCSFILINQSMYYELGCQRISIPNTFVESYIFMGIQFQDFLKKYHFKGSLTCGFQNQ